jgi:hypothetical protein
VRVSRLNALSKQSADTERLRTLCKQFTNDISRLERYSLIFQYCEGFAQSITRQWLGKDSHGNEYTKMQCPVLGNIAATHLYNNSGNMPKVYNRHGKTLRAIEYRLGQRLENWVRISRRLNNKWQDLK